MRETVLYYAPEGTTYMARIKGVLVLCGFSDRRLDELLQRLRKAGVPRTVLKAVVTESNAQWTVYELYGHLVEERRQV